MKRTKRVLKCMPKNNNLDNYRKKLVEINEALVRTAIEHIQKIDGEVTFSNVSKVTYDLADTETGQKGLTLAAITKNTVYRALVESAKASQSVFQAGGAGNSKTLTSGDLRLSLHTLRVENAKFKQDNKLLKHKLMVFPEHTDTVEPIQDKIIRNANVLIDISRSIVNRLCELEIAYIDVQTETVRLIHYENVIVPKEALYLFYNKELENAKFNIRKNAADD